MGGSCTGLLEVAANPLELTMSVPEFPAGCEVRCTGGGDVDDAKVNAENGPVLVVILCFDLFLRLVFAEPEVEVILTITL